MKAKRTRSGDRANSDLAKQAGRAHAVGSSCPTTRSAALALQASLPQAETWSCLTPTLSIDESHTSSGMNSVVPFRPRFCRVVCHPTRHASFRLLGTRHHTGDSNRSADIAGGEASNHPITWDRNEESWAERRAHCLVRMCGALTQLQFCQRSRIRDPNQPKRGGPVGSSRRTDARRPVQTDGQQMKQMGLRVDAEHPPKKSPGRAVRTIGFRAQSGCGLNLRVSNIQRVEARDDDRETRRPDLSKTLVCALERPLSTSESLLRMRLANGQTRTALLVRVAVAMLCLAGLVHGRKAGPLRRAACFCFIKSSHRHCLTRSRIRQSSSFLSSQNQEDSVGSSREALLLTELHDELARLNDGKRINVNSPKQVSAAIFGSTDHSVNRSILEKVADGEWPGTDPHSQRMASLVMQCRQLHTKSGNNRKSPTLNEPISGPSSSNIPSHNENELSFFDRQVESLFSASGCKIPPYWKGCLLQLTRPSARTLVSQLSSRECPMGFDPLAVPLDPLRRSDPSVATSSTTTAGKKGSFLAYCREQKEKYPDCVILTRCGDFYETFGVDAIMLVEHCGLNAMAGKAKAGCPIRNVQATLDLLTMQGFRVAVYEEGVDTDSSPGASASGGSKSRIKSRFLAQIVSSASPTYLYDLVLLGNADTLVTAPPSRPYVGVLSLSTGYTLVEVAMDERSVRVSERLTAEAVACRLAAYPPADPLLFVPSPGEYDSMKAAGGSMALPFLPSRTDMQRSGPGARLRTQILPPSVLHGSMGVSDAERAKNVVVSGLLQMTESREDDTSSAARRATIHDFTLLPSSIGSPNKGATHTNPLYVETATQLGLMHDKTIPSLISSLLPDSAPAATRRFLRRFLLTPPPPIVGEAMANLVAFLKDEGPVLPPLSIPPVGKVLALLRAGQASAQVYGELMKALNTTTLLLETFAREVKMIESLMVILEYESGMAAEPESLRRRCLDAIAVIEDVVSPIHHARAQVVSDELMSDYRDLIPRAFFERNEASWRGRVRREAAPVAYKRVEKAAERLADAVADDFWLVDRSEFIDGQDSFERKSPVVQDIFNNLIALKEVPDGVHKSKVANYFHPRDRNGKILRNRFTTEKVREALADYVGACDEACEEVSTALVRLSRELYEEGHIPAIVQASHVNLILSAAFYHAAKASSLGWNLGEAYEGSPDTEARSHFNQVWPYWMDRSEAVTNTFSLDSMWILTAPNMSGKSTIMRSTATAALLTICGLCAPFSSRSTVRRFDHIFVRGASSDVPSEHKSAFGAEMGDIAALMRCCGERSLVFVDELGRGTSPRDGTRLAGAVLEAMAVSRMTGIFATHLHDILHLPLMANERIERKRMAIHHQSSSQSTASNLWTYRVEEGVCTDSLALETAERFGLPRNILQRAEALSVFLPVTTYPHDTSNPVDNGKWKIKNGASKLGGLSMVVQMAKEMTGQDVVLVPPCWSVPASFDGKSSVYILELDVEPPRYYVGETDYLRNRIERHRSKGGMWSNLEAVILEAPQGKSQARLWESLLIQKLSRVGVDMESTWDGRTIRSPQ